MNNPKKLKAMVVLPIALLAVMYAAGYIAQFTCNYSRWQDAGGYPGDGTSPALPSAGILDCLKALFSFPYGVIGLGVVVALFGVLFIIVMKMGHGDKGEYDRERNLIYSAKGTYGTSGFMSEKEMHEVLDLVPDIRKHDGTILGELNGKAVCIPKDTRYNSNIAVYGASGSKKTRAYVINKILQSAKRGESLIITDPKSGATRS